MVKIECYGSTSPQLVVGLTTDTSRLHSAYENMQAAETVV